MSALPNSWLAIELGDVIDYGKTEKAEPADLKPDTWVLELEDVEKETSKILARIPFSERQSKSTKNRFKAGDVLYGKLRPYLNKVVRADSDGVCTTEIIPLRGNDAVDSSFLFYWLKHPTFLAYVTDVSHGVNMPRLGTDSGKKAPLVLAPLPEQKRIADKLDATLARVDACRERLARVAPILKRFRQSVLAAATSGQLTADWREQQGHGHAGNAACADEGSTTLAADDERRASQTQLKLGADGALVACAMELVQAITSERMRAKIKIRGGEITPKLEDLTSTIEMPDSWAVVGFDAIAAPMPNALKAGPFGSALKKDMYVPAGYKIYGQEQVISGDENFGDYFIDEDKYKSLESCAVSPGDILVSLVGTIGKVLILSDKCQRGIINPRLVKLSLHSRINRQYISLFLRSPIAQQFFSAQSHGGTMDVLNLGILRELPILLPPVAEQTEIVRRVETLFAFADRLEARLASATAAAERLTPSLLAKAFRGELVPQDPNDEPACELLKRLAASRESAATAPKAKRGRKPAAA